ncbi:morphogenetic protein [Klebsiella pneumoniae]|uniref:morphogenetic protein n=1 Tax=Klebsiella pneumoniae TaxID=573 RepID=UPI0010AC1473|nr:morphogenetic protein [Klebsiella pneumoniae]MBH1949193.1 morphogenetic protein [Klebsiella pneumoniae]MBH1955107.1 morphogenetic protein [Klebsiella pneumoniae]TJY79959.1 morphogenetic protein [Klebsiella pneumoniae]TJY82071.1 morphogenetic protein [Klebsiella pneumoniae]TJY85645.1 morphogenetic protein [Klebsiella pneumoniae]
MKERGMIFNGEMVRAILDGRKTQTRRIIKDCTVGRDQISKFIQIEKKFIGCYPEDVPELIRECCPYGVPGDSIWVRETWARYNIDQNSHDIAYRATTPEDWPEEGCWRPSIHMPRWASRILLEITDVRVERLNAISEEDAEAEGIDMEALYDSQDCYDCIADHNMTGRPTVTGAFKYLWESIYGEEGWKSNPWVWVIEFKRVEGGAA